MSVAPVRVWGTSLARCALWFLSLDSYFFAMSACLMFTKTSKKQRWQERTTVRCHLDAIFKFKMLADRRSKKFFWPMISIKKIIWNMQKSRKKFCSNWVCLVCEKILWCQNCPTVQGFFFWNTRIRWGWSATVTEGRAHFFVSPYWLVWDCVWDWVGVVLKCTMGLFWWTDFAHVSRATP